MVVDIVAVVMSTEEDMTRLELLVAKMLYGWQCPIVWQRFAHSITAIVDDAFFDLFLMLCIVANTVLMAMDHAGISDNMATFLTYGNYVSSNILLLYATTQS